MEHGVDSAYFEFYVGLICRGLGSIQQQSF